LLFDANIAPLSLNEVADLVRAAEAVGFDGLWSNETRHDPFLPLAVAAAHSHHVSLGTAIAVGFARSPTTLAYTAWDLARASAGRFILGLGTQVQAHVERRFGMPWPSSPIGKLRELVAAVRAVWQAWQTGERLNFRRKHYQLTLMTPFFDPGPIDHPRIPIYLAGVNRGLAALAGEIADGFFVHPLHSVGYVGQVVRPAIGEAARRAGRRAEDVALMITAFTATDGSQEEEVRSHLAFYASTPSYRPVMAHHGWVDTALELSARARRGAWEAMPGLITREMLDTFAVLAPPERLGEALVRRYAGVADRLALYTPFQPDADERLWRMCREAVV
jgi:probable F420-dependent oxidoreductase